jgi:hypothetical protein
MYSQYLLYFNKKKKLKLESLVVSGEKLHYVASNAAYKQICVYVYLRFKMFAPFYI